MSIATTLNDPVTANMSKRRPTRPPPIDVNLAQQMRALLLLPHCRTPTPSSSDYSASTSSSKSPKRTPLYVHIYAGMRSPASSTPMPDQFKSPEKVPAPATAIYQPRTPGTVTSPSTSISTYSGSWYSPYSGHPHSSESTLYQRDRIMRAQTTTLPFARSRRLGTMLNILVTPIDTDTQKFGTNPNWYRTRTPVLERWNFFSRPSQLRRARLAAGEWYGVEDVQSMPGTFADEDESDVEESMSKAREGLEDNRDGWKDLPTPISPLEI